MYRLLSSCDSQHLIYISSISQGFDCTMYLVIFVTPPQYVVSSLSPVPCPGLVVGAKTNGKRLPYYYERYISYLMFDVIPTSTSPRDACYRYATRAPTIGRTSNE